MNQNILEAKQDAVKEIEEKAKNSKCLLIAEYRGLNVSQLQELRRALKKENVTLSIYKNSLVSRALTSLGYQDAQPLLTGPNSFIFSEDELSGIKIVNKYVKKFDGIIAIKGAIIDGQIADKQTIMELNKVPSREGLIAMLLSCLNAPMTKFACAVKAVSDAK